MAVVEAIQGHEGFCIGLVPGAATVFEALGRGFANLVVRITGDVQGDWVEVGYLILDIVTGEGFFMAEGTFTGTVLGTGPGTATLRVQGEVKNFFVTERGHFVITMGEDGLAGVHAWGTYDYIVGLGGSYAGLALYDERP